ncbi:MAG: glycosyltransferase family 4 protein [Candidatus Diapherotrites archaeon]|uniref:Glycosyltransferase family 4 protein n=1 Tax=Candidatus Iainarchaeum sp. TaxID=3101447 RepID=A0A8T3YIA7_9ARCH|nr:glycosyltransferase family 4 protein [Candidatus Diapherotrites archaeon]
MTKPVLFLSSYPPRECGIATFTKDLSDSMQKKFGNAVSPKVIAVNESGSTLHKYGRKVALKLTEQDIASYESAARKINRMKDAGVVNIQHEFGLFGGEYGGHILRFMELLNRKIVTTLHTVLDSPPREMKENVQQIAHLSDRVVVMTETARSILLEDYGLPPEKLEVIPHGVPNMRPVNALKVKRKYGVRAKNVLLTFGLLSRGKGVENVIKAMPGIIGAHPDTEYLVVGQTHPRVREIEGESYRQELRELAEGLGVGRKVKFLDKFLTLEEISECLQMATIYLSPSIDPKQICSGTVSYAMGAGRAIVSSRSNYNNEVLASGRGILVRRTRPEEFASETVRLLGNDAERRSLERNAYEYSRKMTWPNVSARYYCLFDSLSPFGAEEFSNIPRASFRHFSKMTDGFGMVQFANHSEPDTASGYTLDDNARALVVAAKAYERYGTKKMLCLASTYLSFVEKCQLPDGRFHNTVDGNREFSDDIGSEDSFGRAVNALGYAVQSGLPEEYRIRAKRTLEKAMEGSGEIISPRAQADTLIGIANSREFLSEHPFYRVKDSLIGSLISKYEESSDKEWHWFEHYLTYGNATLPEALFEAAIFDSTGMAEKVARESMDFLTRTLFIDGKLVPIGQEKWYTKGEERAMFDQQPIEAGGMTVAYRKAFERTGDHAYARKARESFDWFLGKNSMNQAVYDETTGGCYDGLTPNGVNANQGAEATISYLLARLMVV